MVRLAGIAEALGKIVWANAAEVDARHRDNGVEVVEHGDIFQQSAHQHLFVCLATKSTFRLPHCEQRRRLPQSRILAPSAIAANDGWML
jgi:hypothetical protein